ncbi:MAG TPA: DUF488 domain-containing protein [Phycisphaerae bacterium]
MSTRPTEQTKAREAQTVFSIGHSNHSLEGFLSLLRSFQIEALADVRSQPASRFSPHFNATTLRAALEATGVRYVFLGEELGGRPRAEEFYDVSGHVRYDALAGSAVFLQGIRRLQDGIATHRIAVMCSEENPRECHRYLLISRVLECQGTRVLHIRGDGRSQTADELIAEAARERGEDGQLPLFAAELDVPWKSIRPVLPGKARRNSSER